MASFPSCEHSKCQADAEYKCACSQLFCNNHYRRHYTQEGFDHQSTLILLSLNPSELSLFSEINLPNIFNAQITHELERRRKTVQHLMIQIKEIERDSSLKIESILKEFKKFRALYTEIREKEAVPIISENDLALKIGTLKKKNNLSTETLNELLHHNCLQNIQESLKIEEILDDSDKNPSEEIQSALPESDLPGIQIHSNRFDFSNPKLHRVLNDHDGRVLRLGVSPCSNLIASGSSDKTIKIWNLHTATLLGTLNGHSRAINSVHFSSTSKCLVSGSDDKTVKIWNLSTFECEFTYKKHSDWVSSACFSPNDRKIASGSEDCEIHIWKPHKADYNRATLIGHSGSITKLMFSKNGRNIISSSWDKTIKMWDLNTQSVIQTFTGHTDSIYTFDIFNQLLVSAGKDHSIVIWDTETGEIINILKGHSDSVLSVEFSESGEFIVSGSEDDSIRVWNYSEMVTTISDISTPYAQFLRNSIVSGHSDKSIKIWNFE